MIRSGDIKELLNCKAIICDLDGTLYLGESPIPGAAQFLEILQNSGRPFFYFTNNTSKSRKTYLAKLSHLGFPARDPLLITAADCTESYLKRHSLFPRIYLVGNRDLQEDFSRRGFICLDEEQALKEPAPAAVVLGFDTEITYAKIHACYQLVIRDIPYIATHADRLCPLAGGRFMPDVGSFISLFETATGRLPLIMGKPTREAVQAISERAHQTPEHIAFIGDRLYTDMRMAEQNQMIGVLVLSGETSEHMVSGSADQPRIVIDSVADLTDTFIQP
jgi:4-nitrophenyl phosphatase